MRLVGVMLLGGAVAVRAVASPADAPVRLTLAADVAPRNEAAERGKKQLDDGDFEDAVKTLTKGLEQPDLTDDQLVELYRLLGLASLYLGNTERARDAFEKLLQARPDYELPKSTPPKIATLYKQLKEDIRKRRVKPVTVGFSALEQLPGNEAVDVPVQIDDLALGAKAKLYYRRAGVQAFSSVDFVRVKGEKSAYVATIPAFDVPKEKSAYELEYYLEVTDAAQRRLAGKGDSYNPLSVRVRGSDAGPATVTEGPPWYKNPWVWVGVGAGAAAIGTASVLLATQHPTATLPVKIQIEGTP